MEVIDIIKQIQDEKRDQNIVPNHAMLIEVINRAIKHDYTSESVNEYLSTLKELGRIEMGNTINSKYIKTI